jgi:hypothetical protein
LVTSWRSYQAGLMPRMGNNEISHRRGAARVVTRTGSLFRYAYIRRKRAPNSCACSFSHFYLDSVSRNWGICPSLSPSLFSISRPVIDDRSIWPRDVIEVAPMRIAQIVQQIVNTVSLSVQDTDKVHTCWIRPCHMQKLPGARGGGTASVQ